jgi:excinuclease ABC subunit C
VLDEIPGLGPARKKRLIREMGSVNAVKAAPLETFIGLTWLPNTVALAVYDKIHGAGAGSPGGGVHGQAEVSAPS